eukprot:m.199580 g.199580  ORF g.199580 m.199580 type:complete len:523 (-) comp20781_c0_seq1:127-1695(-)
MSKNHSDNHRKAGPNEPRLCADCCCASRPPGAGFVVCYVPPDDCMPKCLRIFLNILFAPFYWVWRAINIYMLACVTFYFNRCFGQAIKVCCCVPCGATCFYYKDDKFPADASSLGMLDGKTPHQLQQEYQWIRAGDLFKDKPPMGDCTHRAPAALFLGKAEPADIEQGQLGDCWLMTAIACMASVSNGAMHNLFVTKEYSDRGKYTIRLYDGLDEKWKRVTIDDKIPTKDGKPIFAKPNDRELWCILMEKAMAKVMGGYDMLNGGNILVGFQALTGDPVFHLGREGDSFQRYDLKYFQPDKSKKDSLGRVKRSIGLRKIAGETFNKNDLFDMLRSFSRNKALIGAGTGGKDEGTSTALHGLIQGHAYSVLNAKEVTLTGGVFGHKDKVKLVQLRNPWGSFEWDGAWSDKDKNWTTYKNVAKKLKQDGVGEDDGVFWMPYDDFWVNFKQIDVCDRSTGFGDLALDIDEAKGFCGPLRGCTWGCIKYWCMCKMCRASAFGHVGGEPVIEGAGMRKQYFHEVSSV